MVNRMINSLWLKDFLVQLSVLFGEERKGSEEGKLSFTIELEIEELVSPPLGRWELDCQWHIINQPDNQPGKAQMIEIH